MSDALDVYLDAHAAELARYVAAKGRGLLRFETADDLAQATRARALAERARFVDHGEKAFRAYAFAIARSVIADRAEYWNALKRHRARMLRLTWSDRESTTGSDGVGAPATHAPGPHTHAVKREQLDLLVRVLAALPERDRRLLQWTSEGVSIAEQAARLGITHEAAQRAGVRARERLTKAFRLAAGGGG